jgi:hypothetical protein
MPGQYGSFAAIAPTSWLVFLPFMFWNYSGSAAAHASLRRGHLLSAGLQGSFDGPFLIPTYTRDSMVLGARPSVSLAFAPAYAASGQRHGGSVFASRSDSLFGRSDIYATTQFHWNVGNHKLMTYLTGRIPVGHSSPTGFPIPGLATG